MDSGFLAPLGALVPDGAGDGLRGYGDVLLPASLCSAVELLHAASLDELRDQDEKPCAPESLHASYFTEPALRESDDLGAVFTVGKGGGAHFQGAARATGPHQKRGRCPQKRRVGRAGRVAGGGRG